MKKLLLLLFIIAKVAFAQQYPSPTFFKVNTIDPVASWTISTIYDSSRVNLNNFNISWEFGANTVGMVQGIVGAINVPSSATVMGANAVAGYSLTQSTVTNAVGIYGQGLVNTAGVGNAWGGNTLVANCPLPTCATNTGQTANLYGFEIDVNTAKNSGGGTPAGNFRGLLVTGNLNTAPVSDFTAIEVATAGTVPWANGLKFWTGCCTFGVVNSPVLVGVSQPSFQTVYQSTSAGNVTLQGQQFLDAFGNMQITPGSGGVVSLNNGSQVSQLKVGGTNTVSVAPFQPTYPGGIIGNITGSSPSAGSMGEVLTNSTTNVAMSNATSTNCTSVSLTAGDWEVWGQVVFQGAATTVGSAFDVGVNTTSATLPALGLYNQYQTCSLTQPIQNIPAVPRVIRVSATTTVYMIGNATFNTSTMTCNGYISAHRIN